MECRNCTSYQAEQDLIYSSSLATDKVNNKLGLKVNATLAMTTNLLCRRYSLKIQTVFVFGISKAGEKFKQAFAKKYKLFCFENTTFDEYQVNKVLRSR